MIIIYRIITLAFNLIGVVYTLILLLDMLMGNSSLTSSEDLIVFLFIIVALYFSISFNIETIKHFKKETHRYKIIDAEEIKQNLKRKEFSKFLLNGNLIIGIVIVLLMILVILSEPFEEFLEDHSRLISIFVIAVYGLIQVHFSIIVKRKLRTKN